MPTLPGLSQPCTAGFPVIHVRDAWSICGVFGATAFFRVWRFTHARSTTQTTLPRLPCGQLDALTSPYSGHQKTIGLAGLSSTGFTEVPGLTSLSRTVGNGFAFQPSIDVCRTAPKQSHGHQRRSALPAVRETFGPPNAALLLPRPDGPNEIASSRRPVAWPPSALALPCSLRGVTLSDRRPWLGSDPWKVDVCREDGITRPAALRSFPRTVWTPFFGIWLNLELSL